MPQASDELRALMQRWFGEEIDETGPVNFLMSHGFTESAGMIYKPTRGYTVSSDEYACIDYLCDEWDYGYNNGTWGPDVPGYRA